MYDEDNSGPKTGLMRMLEIDGSRTPQALVAAGKFRIFDPSLLLHFPLEPVDGRVTAYCNFDCLGDDLDSASALTVIRTRFRGRAPRFRLALEFAAKYPDFERQEPLVVPVARPDGTLGPYVLELSFFAQSRIARPMPATVVWSRSRRFLYELA